MRAEPSALAARVAERGGSFPGALLLAGPSEMRLDRESRRLAAILLCPGEDPENRCGSCRRVFCSNHPDFFPVDPEGVQIRIDRVREAIAFAAGRPYESARRVARVSRAELLGLEAGNALLKSLEEPGSLLHWILTTTTPESLLPTIRSRCVRLSVASPSRSEQQRAWRDRGFTAEEAADLASLANESEQEEEPELQQHRRRRSDLLEALSAGLLHCQLSPLLLAAENLAKAERWHCRLLSELLADASLLASGLSTEFLRHGLAAGALAQIARSISPEELRRAALLAADPPPDNRRGNVRLHLEALLLDLYLARCGRQREEPA